MMRLTRTSLLFFCLGFLASCASATPDYFPTPTTGSAEFIETYFRHEASTALRIMKEPNLAEADAEPAYRMLLLTGVTPIHAVRITPIENGEAKIVVNILDAGYRVKGRRKLAKQITRVATEREFAAFMATLEDKASFYDNAMPTLELYQLCMHASHFIYEFRLQDSHEVIYENYCAHTAQGVDVMRAFYAIAHITPDKDSDWTLIGNFRDE